MTEKKYNDRDWKVQDKTVLACSLEEWVETLSSCFYNNQIAVFLNNENCRKMILGSPQGRELARMIVEKLKPVAEAYLKESATRKVSLPAFQLACEEAKKTKTRRELFGGSIKERNPSLNLYDIFVEKI